MLVLLGGVAGHDVRLGNCEPGNSCDSGEESREDDGELHIWVGETAVWRREVATSAFKLLLSALETGARIGQPSI